MGTLIVTFFVFCFSLGLLAYCARKLESSRCEHKVDLSAPNPYHDEDEFKDLTVLVTLTDDPQDTLQKVVTLDKGSG